MAKGADEDFDETSPVQGSGPAPGQKFMRALALAGALCILLSFLNTDGLRCLLSFLNRAVRSGDGNKHQRLKGRSTRDQECNCFTDTPPRQMGFFARRRMLREGLMSPGFIPPP
jgi:hypothetical protein